jgi:nitroreductase
MRTAGTTRRFLPDPVPAAVLHRVLDNARFAPNGGNRQGWHVIEQHAYADAADTMEALDLLCSGFHVEGTHTPA